MHFVLITHRILKWISFVARKR